VAVNKDYYKILGVPKDAPAADIKKAYRKLARQYHPDANKGDAASEEKFKEISEAYDVLSDDKRRKEYDDSRSVFGNGGFRPPGNGAPGGFNFDLGDLLGGLFNRTGGPTTGTGTGGRTSQARRGADVETEVTLKFSDSIDGATVSLRLTSDTPCSACSGTGAKAGTTPRVCPTCSGTGQVSRNQGGFAFSEPCRDCKGRGLLVDDPCPVCHGSGRAASSRTIQARIPAGVRDGQRIRLTGKGASGERGGPAGDLYVVVHVSAHAIFGREDDNLTVTVPVTYPEAVLGAEIQVPTLGGLPVTVKLPANSQNGRVLRVRGRGVARKDGSKGDLLVRFEIAVPAEIGEDARAALQKYQEATGNHHPRTDLLDAAKGE
jgi:molecular chaperone DnaJ